MCGIVGLLPKNRNGFTGIQQKMFYQMLFADQLRGSDATGVITVHKDKGFGIMKEASDAYFFNSKFEDSPLDKDLYRDGIAVIGHNRAKTIGANTDENAHPFVVDSTFAMVHNGTLRNHHELTKTDVDSEALAIEFKKAMDEEDWKAALEDAIGKIRGAFACVWYDQKRHQVCMIRNVERPLGMLETDTCIMFGSEIPMLSWIALRNSEKIVKMESLDVHTLYTFNVDKGGVPDKTFLSPKYTWSATTPMGYGNGVNKPSTTPITPLLGSPPTAQDPVGAAPSTGAKDTDGTMTTLDSEQEGVSKNQFKKIKAQIFRREINFVCEDFVESSGGRSLVMGRSVDGAYDLCEIKHAITGLVELTDSSILWDNDVPMKGLITQVEYEKDQKGLIITVENITVGKTNETVH